MCFGIIHASARVSLFVEPGQMPFRPFGGMLFSGGYLLIVDYCVIIPHDYRFIISRGVLK